MAPSNSRIVIILLVVLLAVSLAGCAKYRAKSAFEEAEELFHAQQYDQAVEAYFAATQDDPGNKIYKLKLIAGRTRAAAYHIDKARILAREDKLEDALAQYRLARGFDPSVEVAALESKNLQEIVDARQKLEEAFVRFREKRYGAARQLVNEVLKVDPQNARAADLIKQLDNRYQAVVMDGIELEIASSEPITLRFKQANIKEVFGILTQLAGINFLLDDEIKDKSITILLEKATFSQAMELILSMAGLDKKVLNSKTMIIYPQNKEKEKQYEDQIIQSFYLSHIDAKKAVNLLRTMLQLRKVYVHEERNALVIRDTPDTIKLAEQVLRAADRENSEVLFDLEILGVSNTDALKLGPNVSPRSVGVGFANEGSEKLVGGVLGTDTSDLVQSLNNIQTFYTLPRITYDFAKTLTDSEVLASPKIRVRNSEKAKVHIGTREPVITVTTTGDTSTDNIQYVDVGVKVDIEPTIQLNQTVQTKLSLEVSQVIDRVQTNNGSVALTISTTNAQSVLTLKDGVQTIIGGLFEQDRKNSKETFPFLGEIPLLGSLLTSFNDSDTKREILLSITPYIVKQIDVPGVDVATIWSGGEDDLMARPKFGAFAQPLLSEVDSTSPAAAPSMTKDSRPAPFAALQGKVAPVPDPDKAAPPLSPSLPTAVGSEPSPGVPATPAAGAIPVAPQGPPAASGVPMADSLLLQPPPVQPAVAPALPPPAASQPVLPPPSAPVPVVPTVPGTPAAPESPAQPPIVLPLPAKGSARLGFSGPDATNVGAEFELKVQVVGVDRLYSAPLFVNYNPALLELTGVEEGLFLGQGGQTTVFSHSPNTAAGQVVVGYKQGVGGAGASGDGILFTLRFRGKAAGTARVEINRINFRDPAGTRLTIEPAAISIVIR